MEVAMKYIFAAIFIICLAFVIQTDQIANAKHKYNPKILDDIREELYLARSKNISEAELKIGLNAIFTFKLKGLNGTFKCRKINMQEDLRFSAQCNNSRVTRRDHTDPSGIFPNLSMKARTQSGWKDIEFFFAHKDLIDKLDSDSSLSSKEILDNWISDSNKRQEREQARIAQEKKEAEEREQARIAQEKKEAEEREQARIAQEKKEAEEREQRQTIKAFGFKDLKTGLTSQIITELDVCNRTWTSDKIDFNRNDIPPFFDLECYGLDNMKFHLYFAHNNNLKHKYLYRLVIDLGTLVGINFWDELDDIFSGEDPSNIYHKYRNILENKYKLDFSFSKQNLQEFEKGKRNSLYVVYEKGKVVLKIIKLKHGINEWSTNLNIEYREEKYATAFFNDNKPAKAQNSDF